MICIPIFAFDPQVLSKDSVTVTVDAVVYYRIQDPVMSVNNVANAHHSTKLLAQTTLRNVLGQKSLQEMLTDRDSISDLMQVCFMMRIVPVLLALLWLHSSLCMHGHLCTCTGLP